MSDWISSYKRRLGSDSSTGHNLKTQSDTIIDYTFTRDVNYKQALILTKENGWQYVDVKYQSHTTQSILKDNIDYYLQFRPKVHYPIGTYVIVPDDTSFEVNVDTDNPFNQKPEERTQWWLIVGRNEDTQIVQYNILKCNWNFQWVYNGKIQSCYGCTRNASSYTSGTWRDELSSSLDDLTSAWIPDTYSVYGNNIVGLDDTRTIDYSQRFMISNNAIYPKVYMVSKVLELKPNGIIKLSLKQDDYNEKRDNVELRICDYYLDNGSSNIDVPIPITPSDTKTSEITLMTINENGKIEQAESTPLPPNEINTYVYNRIINDVTVVDNIRYFKVTFSDGSLINNNIKSEWKIKLIPDENYDMHNKTSEDYEKLMKITKIDEGNVSVKTGKSAYLIGKKFELTVSDVNGEYKSSVILNVEREVG